MNVPAGLIVFGIVVAALAYFIASFKFSTNLIAEKYGDAWGYFSWMVLALALPAATVTAIIWPYIP